MSSNKKISVAFVLVAFSATTCVVTEDAPTNLALPAEVTTCLSQIYGELPASSNVRACLYLGNGAAPPAGLLCALELSIDALCPNGTCSSEGKAWKATCESQSPVLEGVEPGQKFPSRIEIINGTQCDASPSDSCGGSSFAGGSPAGCFAKIDFEMESDKETGALEPSDGYAATLKYSHARFFDEELKNSAAMPESVCPNIPDEVIGDSGAVTIAFEGSAEGRVSSAPVPFLECDSATDPCMDTIAAGRVYILTAIPTSSGAAFKEWKGCTGNLSSVATECRTAIGNGTSLTAVFGYPLTVATQGPDIGHTGVVQVAAPPYLCEAGMARTCSNVFIENEVVTFQATPGEGERVAEWIGCDAETGINTCSVTMDRKQDVIVVFGDANCGDGTRNPNREACDDENNDGGDGCSANCEVEPAWACDDSLKSVCTGFIVEQTLLATTEGMNAQLTMRMTRAPSVEVRVAISVAAPNTGEVSFSASEFVFTPDDFESTITVTPTEDNVDEPMKIFTIEFGGVTGDDFFNMVRIASVPGTKEDNDEPPVISVLPAPAASEGAPVTFTIELDHPSEFPVSVNYTGASGTAAIGTDFTLMPGVATFNNLATTSMVVAQTLDDTVDEGNESFRLNLDMPVNATLHPVNNFGAGTINDNDLPPVLSISAPSPSMVTEGAANTTFTVTYTVMLSAVSERPISVRWDTRDGTATAGQDYTAATNQALNFAPGQMMQTFTVTIRGDNTDEPDENFFVDLSVPNNATLNAAATTASVTILDDDLVGLTVSNQSLMEPTTASPMTFTVMLAAPASQVVTVDWTSVSGSATLGSDFVGSGSLNFPVGITSRTLQVSILPDMVYEDPETFTVVLSNAVNATVNGSGTGTIPANGTAPVFTVSPSLTVMEGNSPVSAVFTVTMAGQTQVAASVNWTTDDGSAEAPGDYTPPNPLTQTLNFPVGTTSQLITVVIPVDPFDEGDETFDVDLSSPSRATIMSGHTSRTVTITDNDALPVLSIPDTSIIEPASSPQSHTVNVALTPASGRTVTVAWTTTASTAVSTGSGRDYDGANGTLTFTPGQTTRPITLMIRAGNDPTEHFFLSFSAPTNAELPDNQATVTITDRTP